MVEHEVAALHSFTHLGKELGLSGDDPRLGIGFIQLSIEPRYN
jgi:hypothetical protein